MTHLRKGLRLFGKTLLLLPLAALHLWALLALYFWFLGPSFPALLVSGIYAAALWGCFRLAKSRAHGAMVSVVLFLAVVLWWTRREPAGNLLYPAETAEDTRFERELDLLTVSGIRQFRYQSVEKSDPRWASRTYDLTKLKYVDLYFVNWGLPGVAHVITSFVFEDEAPLAVSIELRREQDEPNTLLRGFFKQYEIHYVWADELDVVKLRSNFRKEQVYLHRTNLTPEQGKKMLLGMAARTTYLAEHPEFYNTLTESCGNAISQHLMQARGKTVPVFQRPLSPAAYEKLGYEEGWLLHAKPTFAEDREASLVNARANESGEDSAFSTRIRSHLPTPEVEANYSVGP